MFKKGLIGKRILEKSQLEFDSKNAGNSVINAVCRNGSFRHCFHCEADKILIFFAAPGNHYHINAGVNGNNNIRHIITGDLVNTLPVGNHKTRESQLHFQ